MGNVHDLLDQIDGAILVRWDRKRRIVWIWHGGQYVNACTESGVSIDAFSVKDRRDAENELERRISG